MGLRGGKGLVDYSMKEVDIYIITSSVRNRPGRTEALKYCIAYSIRRIVV